MKTTTITFDQLGGMMVDHEGFVGAQCEEATKNLIGNIGGTTVADRKKPEFFATGTGRATQRVGR